uniref:Uncharacterized protein LOC111102859 n=1 Tax=Crassostrea virginica TaxID=6565 RepID=A0A8B8AN11_CRAVI|nr:uncharacterized protein LOC111102859 [Crassostrea virginica]
MILAVTIFSILIFGVQGSSIQVCLNTLRVVTHCPSNEEEYRKLSEKCSSDCLNNRFELHCVRNSSKKELIAVCAVPAPMFSYCMEYDSAGQVIQMDMTTRCTNNSLEIVYNSADLQSCNPECLRLHRMTNIGEKGWTLHVVLQIVVVSSGLFLLLCVFGLIYEGHSKNM